MAELAATPAVRSRVRTLHRDASLWFVLGMLAATTLLHYLTDAHLIPYHSIYRSLYYVPIAVAAVRYGRRGGVLTALVTSALYLPHVLLTWGTMPTDSFNDLLENGVFLFVGVLAGSLADAERAQRQRAERASEDLEVSYAQLQAQGEQMRRAERQAALGRLAGGLAHEIRNPLAIVRAAAQLLGQQVPPAQQEYTHVMMSEINRVDKLIEQLLHYAEPRPLTHALVDAAQVIAHTVHLCQPYAAQQQVSLRTAAPPAFPLITGDAERLQQALLNLVLNALQATPAGGEVTVTAAGTPDRLVLRICDTGPGVPASQQTHIFDPFFTTRTEGTGLGLTMVQQIVQEHGGQISVSTAPGSGAVFTIELPVRPT